MKSTGRWFAAMVLAILTAAPAVAETDKPSTDVTVRSAAWERVGEAGPGVHPAEPARVTQSADEEALRARKAEALRRVFWIVLALR